MLIRSERGFTLIELMIVVAIIGILSAIGVPAYLSYTARAQVMEGLSLAGGWKAAIVEYYAANGSWPSQPDLNGTTPSVGVYASQVTVITGVIKITYAGAQANKTTRTSPRRSPRNICRLPAIARPVSAIARQIARAAAGIGGSPQR
jgi:type IV pilus assembly protein PilA